MTDRLYSWWIADVVTGQKIEDVTRFVIGKGGDFERQINGYGNARIDLNLRESSHGWMRHNSWFTPWAQQLVRVKNTTTSDQTAIHAGIITNWAFNPETGVVSLDCSEHEILFSRRFPFTIGRFPEGSIEMVSTSDRAVMFEAIRKTFLSFPTPRSRLPLVMTYAIYDEPGPSSWSFPARDFNSLADILEAVSDAGGPDFDMRTHHWAGENQFVVEPRIGSPYLHTHRAPFEFDAGAPESNVFGYRPSLDALDQFTGQFATAEGTEDAIKRREAAESGISGYTEGPYMDDVEMHPQETDLDMLNRLVYAARDAHERPSKRVKFSMLADAPPFVENLYPGLNVWLRTPEDEMHPAKREEFRVLSYSGDDTTVDFILEGIREA